LDWKGRHHVVCVVKIWSVMTIWIILYFIKRKLLTFLSTVPIPFCLSSFGNPIIYHKSFVCAFVQSLLWEILTALISWAVLVYSSVLNFRHLLHHCFQALMDHGVKVSEILAESYTYRCQDFRPNPSQPTAADKIIQLGFALGK